jgi:hypothetical protein
MDEAEALCKRIGIMVNGQLRALGTKQHLKNKFGSGFELVVKLIVTDLNAQINEMSAFVKSSFPSAVLISENGGLLTYQIPKEEMKMGVAFTMLEGNKKRLNIEDYSVAQPTLEQVFIRTVNSNTDNKAMSAGSATVIGGGASMSVEGTHLLDKEHGAHSRGSIIEDVVLNAFDDAVVELNKCGCSNRTTCFVIFAWLALTLILLAVGIGLATSRSSATGIVWTFAFICLIATLITVCVRYCAFCQYPKGTDE